MCIRVEKRLGTNPPFVVPSSLFLRASGSLASGGSHVRARKLSKKIVFLPLFIVDVEGRRFSVSACINEGIFYSSLIAKAGNVLLWTKPFTHQACVCKLVQWLNRRYRRLKAQGRDIVRCFLSKFSAPR